MKLRFQNLILHLLFIPLFFLAFFFYKERLFGDSGSDLFWITVDKFFAFGHGRIIALLAQWMPLLAVHVGQNLKIVAIIYSIGHVMFFYLLFLIALYKLKDQLLAIGLLLVQTAGVLYLFYFLPNSEVIYCVGLLMLFYSILRAEPFKGFWNEFCLFILTLFILLGYPVMIILMLFALAYDYFENRRLRINVYIYIGINATLAYVMMDDYVSSILDNLTLMMAENIRNLSRPEYLWDIISVMFTYLLALTTLLFITLIYYVYNKKYLKFTFNLVFFFGYLLMIMLINGVGYYDSAFPHPELYFFPLTVLVLIPFLYDAYQNFSSKGKKGAFVLICVIVLFKTGWIAETGNVYTERVELLERLIRHCQQLEGSKFYVQGDNIHKEKPMDHFFTVAQETFILSALEGKENTVSIFPIHKNMDHILIPEIEKQEISIISREAFTDKDYLQKVTYDKFITNWGVMVSSTYLNTNYYHFPNGSYKPLNKKRPGVLKQYKTGIKVIVSGLVEKKPRVGEVHQIPVKIINTSNYTFYSHVSNGFKLDYLWKKDGAIVEVPSFHSKVEVDVISKYEQYIKVQMPFEPGLFTLMAGITDFDGKWYGVDPNGLNVQIIN